MEAAPSVKPRRVSPPVPPNYVSLRQLQELRLKEKEEQEMRQREEAARKAEMKAIAATIKAEKKVSAASSVASGWAKERRDGGRGHQWVAVVHQPTREEGLFRKREGATGVGRSKKGPADAAAKAPRGGGKQEGKAKGAGEEKASAVTSAKTRAAGEPGKPAEASSREGKPENRGIWLDRCIRGVGQRIVPTPQEFQVEEGRGWPKRGDERGHRAREDDRRVATARRQPGGRREANTPGAQACWRESKYRPVGREEGGPEAAHVGRRGQERRRAPRCGGDKIRGPCRRVGGGGPCCGRAEATGREALDWAGACR